MSLSSQLTNVVDLAAYPATGVPERRWGQMLREGAQLGRLLDDGRSSGLLVPLRELASLQGGVVTRANAYFLLSELPFGGVPSRFRLTRSDYRKVAVLTDGLDTRHRIERRHLRRALKGPESLSSPTRVDPSELRLFAVEESEDELKTRRDSGALEYIKRGRTQAYDVSDDRLKGGIPAERSNIKNRKPHWYSLSVPPVDGSPRLILPEHVHHRYPVTLVRGDDSDLVVLDKLYVARPNNPDHAEPLLAALNSALTWAQLELRGRTQLGQGVLELKKPEWAGVLVLNPNEDYSAILESFAPLSDKSTTWELEQIDDEERAAFDRSYLAPLVEAPEEVRQFITITTLTGASERHDRAASIKELQKQAKRQRRVATSVDAHASRLAALLEPFPDPRSFLPSKSSVQRVELLAPADGRLSLGDDLFTVGAVLSDGEVVAEVGDELGANYALGVLTHDPYLEHVDVPVGEALEETLNAWGSEGLAWMKVFDSTAKSALSGIADRRLESEIRGRAKQLLHVPEVAPPLS